MKVQAVPLNYPLQSGKGAESPVFITKRVHGGGRRPNVCTFAAPRPCEGSRKHRRKRGGWMTAGNRTLVRATLARVALRRAGVEFTWEDVDDLQEIAPGFHHRGDGQMERALLDLADRIAAILPRREG